MPNVDIIQLLKQDGGEKFYPVTHVDAVIGLKDSSFFETVQDTQDPTKYSVKLKDEYTGLWADGWIAAGGIGTGSGGGGGGLIQTVYTWSDLQEMSSSPADDTGSAFNAKTVYEIYQMLQSGGLGGGGYLKEAGGGFFLTSSRDKILLKGAGHSLSSLDDVSVYNPAVNDLLTWSGYSWVNIPQSAVRPDLSGYVTTDTFGAAILDLQTQIDALENFFEIDSSGNVTLKSTYQNLWVPGWLAAGGIGAGGGGGGSQVLDDLLDVTISSPSNGDVLVYNGTGWINGQASAGADLPAVWASLTNSTADSYANTKIDIAHIPNITTSKITDIESWISGKGYVANSDFEDLSGRVSDLEDESFFTLDGSGNVTLKSGYSNLWVSGWLAAGGSGSGSGGGSTVQVTNYGSSGTGKIATISVDGVDTDIYNNIKWGTEASDHTIQVTINGTTKWLCVDGYSSGGSGSGSVTSVGMTVPTGLSVTGSPITSSGTLAVSFATGYSIPTTEKQSNWDTAYGWGNHASAGYVTLSGNQEIEGPKTFKTYDVILRSVSLLPYSNGSCSIGGDVNRFSNIYGNNVHIGSAKLSYEDEVLLLSGIDPMGGRDVGFKLNSYIDIGDARLEYDGDAYALRITKRAGSSRTIGLYADGFVAAGGTAASASRNIVFTDGTQTISGLKTFTNTVTIDGSGLDSGVNALNVTGTVSVNGNINATTFGGGIVIEKDAQTYRHISVSDDRLYIQKSVSQDLVLCNGNSSHCVVGTYASPGTNKLYVNGTALATAWNTTSDSRLKDDITALSKDDAIQKLMRLKPSIWKWNSGLAKGHTASGFIAQEVEAVLPFMVTGEDYKGLSYQMLHAYEVSAIQSHEERISALEKEVERLNA